jgi:hypothetical protein
MKIKPLNTGTLLRSTSGALLIVEGRGKNDQIECSVLQGEYDYHGIHSPGSFFEVSSIHLLTKILSDKLVYVNE